MGYASFPTQTAQFVFSGTTHLLAVHNRAAYTGIDALVTEQGFLYDVPARTRHERRLCSDARLGGWGIARALREANVPVFCLDPIAHGRSQEEHNPYAPGNTWAYANAMRRYGFSRSQIPDDVLALIATENREMRHPVITGRSAIVAHKIDHLARMLARKRKSKPVIGIAYGIGHADIVHYLRSPDARKETIAWMSEQGYPSVDLELLNEASRFCFAPHDARWPWGMWKRTVHHLTAFD
jgi:hypothetical protein